MTKRKPKVLETVLKPRFPVAAMAWYGQYSDAAKARQGTIDYVQSLTPGLTEESAGEFIDQLVRESGQEATQTPVDLLIHPVEGETVVQEG